MVGAVCMVGEVSAVIGAPSIDPLIKEARDRQRRRRRRLVVTLVALVAIGLAAYSALSTNSNGNAVSGCVTAPCGAGTATRQLNGGAVLYGFVRNYAAPSAVGRVDWRTLRLVGPTLALSKDFEPHGVSPDGRRLLLVNTVPAKRTGESPLAIVDLATLRPENRLDTRLAGVLGTRRPVAALWQTSRRLLVVAQLLGHRRWHEGPRVVVGQTLLALDARTGAVAWQHRLGATLLPTFGGTGTVGSTAIMVLQSTDKQRLGRGEVLAVSARGVIHSSPLQLIRGGYGSYPARLVVTSDGRNRAAFVFTGGGVAYGIDSATARATRHRLALPPSAPASSPPALLLGAAGLGGNIVVSSFFPRPNGFPAAGIYLIDPHTWTARLIDSTTPAWLVADNRLLTFTNAGQFRLPRSWRSKGTGIRIYDSQGRLRSHLYGRQAFTSVAVTPSFALAVLPTRRSTAAPPQTPAAHRTRNRQMRIQELAFDPSTGRQLGARVQVGYLPGLIQRPKAAPHG
jgi:hypothetical protein